MKRALFCLLAVALLGGSAFRFAASTTYRVDPAASRLTWTGHAETGSYAPNEDIRLRQSSLQYDGRYDGRTVCQGRCEANMKTLRHENSTMQKHLRGDDFFAVERFPTALFELDNVEHGQATGRLALRGVTKPLRFPLTVAAGPSGELRLQGVATVDRTQLDVKFNSSSFFANLGDQAIRNDFQVKFDAAARPLNAKGPSPAALSPQQHSRGF